MCRNIKPLYNFDPPATEDEIRSAALQYVRKISGYVQPTTRNTVVFENAVEKIAHDTKELLDGLVTTAQSKSRHEEERKQKKRNEQRFGKKESFR